MWGQALVSYYPTDQDTELKKVANLANQVRGTLWESRNILIKNLRTFVDLLGYFAIYALLRKFSG